MSTVKGYCSWCYEKTDHIKTQQIWLGRNIYRCLECANFTLICRYCSHMAKGKPSLELQKEIDSLGEKIGKFWDNELCAEHDGTIASFERLNLKLEDISEFKEIFVRDQKDLLKYGKVAVGFVIGSIIVGVVILTGGSSAPLAAILGKMGLLGVAGTGTAIATLSGAALTSASLAAIGGTVAGGILLTPAI